MVKAAAQLIAGWHEHTWTVWQYADIWKDNTRARAWYQSNVQFHLLFLG